MEIININNFIFSTRFEKDLKKYFKNKEDNSKIKEFFFNLKSWIFKWDIKRLKNYPWANFRLRYWNFRVLFNVNNDKGLILFLRILPRKNLY